MGLEINKTSILIVVDSLYDGGAEIYAITLANYLAKFGKSEVVFLELRPWLSSPNCQCLSLLNTEIVNYNFFTGSYFSKILQKTCWKLLKKTKLENFLNRFGSYRLNSLIQNKQIEFVVSVSFDSDSFFTKYCKYDKVKFISTFQGHYELYDGSFPTYDSVVKTIFNRVDAFMIQTQKHLKTLKRFNADIKPLIWFEKGVDFEIAKDITYFDKSESLKLVLTARCIEEKGWIETVKSVIEVKEIHNKNIELLLVGDGVLRNQIESMIKDKPFIKYFGHQKDVSKFVKDAHIGILLSTYEAECRPLTITDYLVLGKPVIATNNGEIDKMLKVGEEYAGFIIPIEDNKPSIEKTVEAIMKIFENPILISEKSKLSIEASKKFLAQNLVNTHLEVFNILEQTDAT